MNLWAVMDLQRPFLGHSLFEFVLDSNQKELQEAEHEHKDYVEIINGSSVLPNTIFEKLKSFENFQYKLERKVLKIVENKGEVSVSMRKHVEYENVYGDYVIVTPTAREVSLMEFDPPLPYFKKLAIDSLEYFGSVKIFLKFKRPFWAEKNKIPSMLYDSKNEINGATGVSDDILHTVRTAFLFFMIIFSFLR